jgi:bacillithiol system protein YtxJ
MNWLPLTDVAQLDAIKEESRLHPVVIFKHSTTCSISAMAKNRLEREEAPEGVPAYYLDLLTYRPISNAIAQQFGIKHESPQLLIIRNGECVYDESHNGVRMDELKEALAGIA